MAIKRFLSKENLWISAENKEGLFRGMLDPNFKAQGGSWGVTAKSIFYLFAVI